MKILVDKMPGWRGDCPFAKSIYLNTNYTQCDLLCQFDNTPCDLYEEDDECRMLKQLNIEVISQ